MCDKTTKRGYYIHHLIRPLFGETTVRDICGIRGTGTSNRSNDALFTVFGRSCHDARARTAALLLDGGAQGLEAREGEHLARSPVPLPVLPLQLLSR
jgi:hypothetical protein